MQQRTWPIVLLLFLSVLTASLTLILYQDIVLRPLGLPDANQLVLLTGVSAEPGMPWPGGWNQGAFTALSVFRTATLRVGELNRQQTVVACLADASFFRVLGVFPQRGRFFMDDDTVIGAPSAAVISDSFWRSYFGSAEDLAETTLLVSGRRFRIVGVLPRGMDFPAHSAIYLPRPDQPLTIGLPSRPQSDDVSHGLDLVIGRLRRGLNTAQARQMEMAILQHLRSANKDANHGIGDNVSVRRIQDFMSFRVQGKLTLLAVAGAYVAFVALGSLLLLSGARSEELRKDIAIRLSLGATTRVLFLKEVLWWARLSVAVSLAVLGATKLALHLLRRVEGLSIPRLGEVTMHMGQAEAVVGGTVAAAAILALPYLVACIRTRAIAATLNQSGFQTRSTLKPIVGKFVSVAQLSVAIALSAATTRVCLNYWHAASIPPGIDPTGVFFCNATLTAFPAQGNTPKPAKGSEKAKMIEQGQADPLDFLLQKLTPEEATVRRQVLAQEVFRIQRAVMERSYVTSAAVAESVPYGPDQGQLFVDAGKESAIAAQAYRVQGDLPRTLGMAVVSGRWFDHEDERIGTEVAVVNHLMAARHYGGRAVGEKIRVEEEGAKERIIVGVVNDTVSSYGDELEPTIYLPMDPHLASSNERYILLVRTMGDTTLPPVRDLNSWSGGMLELDGWSSMAKAMNDAGITDQASSLTASWFALLALFLAAASVYAVMWALSMQRQREMAIRICLGALPVSLAANALASAALLAGIAGALGFLLGRGLERMLSSRVYGFPAFSWSTFAFSFCVVMLTTLLSVAAPAHRLLRLSPAESLRES